MTKWAIIGSGKIAQTFANDLRFVANAQLIGFGSRNSEISKSLAEELNLPKYYSSYRDVFMDADVDAIYIATPHSAHSDNAIEAIRFGKAVLCEKPFTVNYQQAQQVVSAARKHQVLLVEGMWTYFQPVFRQLLNRVSMDEFGKILAIKVDTSFKADFSPESRLFDLNLAGGGLLDVGIYDIALSSALLGKPDFIDATANFGATHVDESGSIQFHYPNKVTAYLTYGIINSNSREAEIVFEKATVKILNPWWHLIEMQIHWNDGKVESVSNNPLGYGFGPMIEEFQRCLDSGLTESSVMPLETTLQNMWLMDQVRKQIGLRYPIEN